MINFVLWKFLRSAIVLVSTRVGNDYHHKQSQSTHLQVRHSTRKRRCRGHQTHFVGSRCVVSCILLWVQSVLAYGWCRQPWEQTHPLLQWEGEAPQCGAGNGLAVEARCLQAVGPAFCEKPTLGQQVPAWKPWALTPAWGWGDPLPILYKFSPALISQTFFSQGSFAFPSSYTRLFSCLLGHQP